MRIQLTLDQSPERYQLSGRRSWPSPGAETQGFCEQGACTWVVSSPCHQPEVCMFSKAQELPLSGNQLWGFNRLHCVYYSLSAAAALHCVNASVRVRTPGALTVLPSTPGPGLDTGDHDACSHRPATMWGMLNSCSFGKDRVQWATAEALVQPRGTETVGELCGGDSAVSDITTYPPSKLWGKCAQNAGPALVQPLWQVPKDVHHQAQVPIFTKWHLEDVSSHSWPQGSSPSTLTPLCLKYKAMFRVAWWNGSSELPSDTKISQTLGKLQYIYLKKKRFGSKHWNYLWRRNKSEHIKTIKVGRRTWCSHNGGAALEGQLILIKKLEAGGQCQLGVSGIGCGPCLVLEPSWDFSMKSGSWGSMSPEKGGVGPTWKPREVPWILSSLLQSQVGKNSANNNCLHRLPVVTPLFSQHPEVQLSNNNCLHRLPVVTPLFSQHSEVQLCPHCHRLRLKNYRDFLLVPGSNRTIFFWISKSSIQISQNDHRLNSAKHKGETKFN